MKQLLSLACMGVLCLLLSSHQAFAQVSRKGGSDQPKVILKKEKNETTGEDTRTETRNERTRTGSDQDQTSTPRRTEPETRTYPDRRREPNTRQERRLPETTTRYPRPERDAPSGDRQARRHGGDRAGNGRSSGYHHKNCDHPGKGRHLGWHKQKHKAKNKGKGKRH